MKKGELDTLDKYILFALQEDSRHTSSGDIAEAMDVASSTVRNRINLLEKAGIIRGYEINIDYEKAGYNLYSQFVCTAPIPEREELARKARKIPGVVKVREVMTGEQNVYIGAIGVDKDDLSGIGRDLAELGLIVVDEELIHSEYSHSFHKFNSKGESTQDEASEIESQ
ncbi:Lrp/AsnC family transcriptional regulator [Haladaptatus sp. CMAA 1911]|uniref:Lrp/AsnC family transcriptional regulator n=1 Tax=unclassified Haladaptatus TaxID=2622732 RepID=UPI003754A72C